MESLNENEYRIIYSKLVSVKGKDNRNRQVVSLYLSCLPDPQIIDYDFLVKYATNNLDSVVTNSYVIVLFCSDMIHKPSWSWIIQTYKELERNYKKNLKALYIVHPSFWSKFLISTLTKIVSPKFAKKIIWITNLHHLSKYVPYNEIKIPFTIYEYEKKYSLDKITSVDQEIIIDSSSSSETSNSSIDTHSVNGSSGVFGVKLEDLMGYEGELGIPKVVSDAIEYLLENGLKEEGLFRRSPSSHLIKTAKEAYNNKNPNITVQSLNSVHLAAVLLKTFVRELPNPIFPSEFYPKFKKINYEMNPEDLAVKINEDILDKIPSNNRILFAEICRLLKEVHLNSEVNLMTSSNLAIVWAPNLVRSGDPIEDFKMATLAPEGTVGTFVRWAIENYDRLFAYHNSSVSSSIKRNSYYPRRH